MARRLINVAKFAGETANDNAKHLIEMMEDYARHDLNDRLNTKFSINVDNTKEEKARKINQAYLAEIERRSGYKVSDFDGDTREYAQKTAVVEFQAMVNKILLDAVTPIIIDATNLSMLAEIHYGGYGDRFEFEMEDDTLYDVSKMGRRQQHTKTQTRKKQNKTIGMDMYGLSTISNLPEIILGEAMIAKDVMLMGMSMNKKIYTLVVKKFIEATDKISDPRFKVSNYTEKTWLEALRKGSAYNGSKMVIVGDDVALKDLLPAGMNTRVFLQDEYNTTLGHMSTFNTYSVLGFDVVADENEAGGVLGLPTNKMYGLSLGNGGKLIHVGIGYTATNTDDEWDSTDLSKVTTLRKELGVELATNKKVAVCDITPSPEAA